MPACCRKAEIPSGRRKGPENSRSTVREVYAGLAASEPPSVSAERLVEVGKWLVASRVAGCRCNCGAGSASRLPPGVCVLVEVHVRSEHHHSRHAGYKDVVCSRCGEAAP
eukprot:6195576-Pleurochrysis_carterae.AAC.3